MSKLLNQPFRIIQSHLNKPKTLKKIVIIGGTGFIGRSLAVHLSDRGMKPTIVGRHAPKADLEFEFVTWDVTASGAWLNALNNADAIVNLAGRTVDCIKTPDNCDEILRSRVDSTKAIGRALKTVTNPPKIWIQMSTAHIYGDPPIQRCTESSSIGYGLAPFVGMEWERTLLESIPTGMREVRLRTSFVIGKNGGALQKLAKLTRAGLGGRVGHGRQGMSWIHQEDLNALIYQVITQNTYHGVYNATAPYPVSN